MELCLLEAAPKLPWEVALGNAEGARAKKGLARGVGWGRCMKASASGLLTPAIPQP